MEYVIVLGAAGTGGLASYLLLDAAHNRRQDDNGEQVLGRIRSVRELGVLLDLTPSLALLAFAGSLLAIFLVLNLLQPTMFALSVCAALFVAFLLSGSMLASVNERRYLRRFEQQLPIVIDQMISQLRGGRTLSQGFNDLPALLDEPASGEIFEISDKSQRGLGLEQALVDAGKKYSSQNYALLIAIFRMFVRQGGNVVGPLYKMSTAYKDLIKADDFIRTASTQGRTIFYIINGAIFFIFGFVSLAQPQLITDIFENVVGVLFFLIGVIAYISGAVWMWSMMRVDV